MYLKKILENYKKNTLLFSFRYWFALKIFRHFSIETKSLLSSRSKYVKIIKKYNDSEFFVNPTGHKIADNHFRKLFKNYKVKGQFLAALRDGYLLTSWSIPVTRNGEILIETSGNLGMLILNIIDDNNMLSEYKFIFYILCIKLSNLLNITLFKVTKDDCFFHIVPRHSSRPKPSPYEPQFGHWVLENLPQVRMFLESLKHSNNCKLFVGRIIKDWQKVTLNLLGVHDKNILSFQQPYLLRVKTIYISRLPYVNSREYNFDPEGRNWMNITMRSNLKIQYGFEEERKYPIIFSRKFYDRRKIICGDDLYRFMNSLGLKIINTDKLSEIEKIKACFNSNLIMGFPSGSAMVNMIYSNKPKIIDILSKEESNFVVTSFLISRELCLDYSLFLCKEKKENNLHHENDFIINQNKFKIFLKDRLVNKKIK